MPVILLAAVVICLTGCQHPGPRFNPYNFKAEPATPLETVAVTNGLSPTLLTAPTTPYTLGPGDRLEIQLVDDPHSLTINTVGPDGKVYFDLLPGTDVWGLTLPQAQDLLQRELAQYYKQQPRLSLTLRGVESRRFWVLGRVQSPGVYFMTNSPTLLEALTEAGGVMSLVGGRDLSINASVEDQADLSRAFLVRQGHLVPVDFERLVLQGDMTQNVYLQPDDFIYLPPHTTRQIFVIGAVALPRAVPYQKGMTLATAIANAGGPGTEAYLSHTAIVRGSISQPHIALVNYKEVLKGNVIDPVLQPNDIVYVPLEPYRYLVRYANLIMDTFVSSVAINEGINAVTSQSSTPAGVFIPVGSRITVTPNTIIGPGPSSP